MISQVFCLRLQKNPRQKHFGVFGTRLTIRRSSPKGGEQILPSFSPLCAQIAGRVGNGLGRALLDRGKGSISRFFAAASLGMRIKRLPILSGFALWFVESISWSLRSRAPAKELLVCATRTQRVQTQ